MIEEQLSKFDLEERSEILSLLPSSYDGKDVIELGLGCGRFTGTIAKSGGQVVAVDHKGNIIEKNEDVIGHHKNNSPRLEVSSGSADLVFSNWLLMFVPDEEVSDFVERLMKWLRPGGHAFIRESCFRLERKRERENGHLKQPSEYLEAFQQKHITEDGCIFKFELVVLKNLSVYVRNKKPQKNEVCWLWKKVPLIGPDFKSFQKFLDTQQYTLTGILRYERIFGYGCVSPGGMDTIKEFVNMLDLKPGQRVLDVGCGIGGADFYMAENFGAEVVGIDLSVNMITLALERSTGTVEFAVADCTTVEYPDASFDVIYSRDTILHIQDKPTLFDRFYKWLKPGGRVLISDYCRAPSTPSEEFAEYIKQRGYDLHSVEAYEEMLIYAEFVSIRAEDRTDQFVEILKKELAAFEQVRDEFIQEFSEDDYDHIVSGWENKLKRQNEQKWGLFVAQRPLFKCFPVD